MTRNDLWNPKAKDLKVKRKRRQKNRKKQNTNFYASKEWRRLRVKILEKYECRCMMCGRSPKEYRVVIHVDHIKPRASHPKLELDEDNLQLLCEDCNLGKGYTYKTDWRPSDDSLKQAADDALDREIIFGR